MLQRSGWGEGGGIPVSFSLGLLIFLSLHLSKKVKTGPKFATEQEKVQKSQPMG